MWPVKYHITVVNKIAVFLRWLSWRAEELCYKFFLGVCVPLSAPLLGFYTHAEVAVQRWSRAARRKLHSVAGLFVSPNCMGPLAAPGKKMALCWLQILEVSEDGEPILETLAACLKDRSFTVSQQQCKPMVTPAAKLSFTAVAKEKLMLHDSSEGYPQSCD